MEVTNLSKLTDKKMKRKGRGSGSGRGKTSGRGTKGQKARGKIKLFFEGGALPLSKRLPFLRGRGRNKKVTHQASVLNVESLNSLPANSTVDAAFLIKRGLISSKLENAPVKILGLGVLKTPLIVKLPTSETARKKIEKAGGKVEV